MSNQIVLVSKEGNKFTTSVKMTNLSGLIHTVLQDYPENEEIQLQSVSSELLQKILEFSNHHNFELPEPPKKPVKSLVLSENISDPWDVNFIQSIPEDGLIEMILAANYLDMKSLMDFCLVRVACKFKGVSPEEIRKEYQINEEFTPEVEESLKADFPWALEVENPE